MKRTIKSSDLFNAFFYINVFCKGIGLSNDSSVYLLLLLFGIFVLAVKYIFTNYTKQHLNKILVLLSIGLLSFIFTRKPTLMLTCLCLSAMKGVDIERLFKGTYYIRLVTFISIVLLSFVGIIENTSIQMWRGGALDIRYSLGFGHPNSLHLAFFILASVFMYVKYFEMNIIKYGIILLSNYFIFQYSGSRTGFGCVLLLVFIMLLSHLSIYSVRKFLCVIPKYILLFMVILSFVLALLYGKVGFINALNTALNGRLSYSNYFITNYGFTFFGNSIVNETNLFDNGYLFLYIQFGIVGLILIIGFLFKICKDIEKTMDVRKAALIIVYLIYIFTESFSPNIFMNISLTFAGPLLFDYQSNPKIALEPINERRK